MRLFGRRRRLESDLDAELEAHLQMAVRERVERGEPEAEARAAAERELGNVGLIRDAVRDEWGGNLGESVLQDARYAVWALVRAPGFAFAAVTALALGIGANTAMLSVAEGILLRPLPYADADRLVVMLHRGQNPVSPANFLDWRRESRGFEAMGAAEFWTPNLTSPENPERLFALRMTADVLPMLGVAPAKGRVFSAAEEQDGSDHVAVISHRLWQRRFGGDPSVVGRTLSLNGEPYAVVGVMPEGFRFAPFWATRSELWAPLSLGPRAASRNGSSLRVFARRKPDVGLDQARAEMAAITGALEREFPGTNRDVSVLPLKEKVVGDIRPALLVLLGAVGLVLLISCANVAHLLLARGAARQREVAVRAALGASRGRILRQMLTESLVLSLAGAALGVGLASLGLQWLLAMAPASIPRLQDVSLDARVLLATLGIALLTGVAFGIVPAFESAAPRQEALREDARSGTGRGHARLRRLFVASEVALALVLMVGAGLLMRSFLALRAVDPGFDPRHVLTMVVSVGGTRESAPERRGVFYRELLERVSAVPGVRAVSAINHLPLAGDIWGVPYAVEGRPEPRPGESPMATYRVVFPGYFRVMGIPILRGRDVASQDDLGAPGVVVVNQFLASHQWPGEDAVGKRIRLDDSPGGEGALTLTVIGVVKDSVQSDWRGEPADEIYLPWLQNRPYLENPRPMVAYTTLVARADGDPAALFPALRVAIASLDPALPVSDVITMERVVADANADSRFQMLLLGLFAAVATVLASTGIYAVMSYAVSRRTREIGVRMAFGAGARQVLRLVIGEAMGVALVGALAGIVGAFFATRLMAGILYGVGPSDPATYASVALLLLAVSLLASYLPARRALGVSPLTALRQD